MTSLLQAVEDVYYWGGGWLEDGAEMAMDDSSTSTGSSPPAKTRSEGTDFSGTNNQEQGVDEAVFVRHRWIPHILFLGTVEFFT